VQRCLPTRIVSLRDIVSLQDAVKHRYRQDLTVAKPVVEREKPVVER
jgi:hypothetical protein